MLKRLLGSPIVQFVIGRSIGLYMLFVGVTTRWRRVNRAVVEPFWAESGSVILCIWHGRFALSHKLWKFEKDTPKAKMLVSQSREGGLIAHTSRAVGAEVIRGSSAKPSGRSKGGFEAMREMLRHIGSRGAICLTPDGPRGPRMRAKIGPVQLAKLSGAPLLPLTWSTRWRVVAKSWDQFVFPLPFGAGALIWGNLIHVPRDADDAQMEAARAALEAELIRITAEADRLVGAEIIQPATPQPTPRETAPAS